MIVFGDGSDGWFFFRTPHGLPASIRDGYDPLDFQQMDIVDLRRQDTVLIRFRDGTYHQWIWSGAPGQKRYYLVAGNYVRPCWPRSP